MALYPYQQHVKELLLSGKSVVLQAPTGSGKTRAALAPYIEAFFERSAADFPHKCIYSVPMRVLANQFYEEYERLTTTYDRRFRQKMKTGIQTGEQAKSPQLLDDLIFATIDQSLSSALAVPYSQSSGMSNINAGAFYASYLIFDEFHLFPSDGSQGAQGALTTTLQLLMAVKGIVPFVLMTATFSSTMLAELGRLLNAEVVQISADEYRAIATGEADRPRSRCYTIEDSPLTAQAVIEQHQSRSVVICNQVQRAQTIFEELKATLDRDDITIMLLHSRFTPEDRQSKEALIRHEFGKAKDKYEIADLILVATQVVEVGLDITCENLHTEIAPANAIFQRAGRCARYPGEEGHVHIYNVPLRESRDGNTKPDYLPYPVELCMLSWQSFCQRDGKILDFEDEQAVIDEVHTDADRQLLAAMQRQKGMIWDDIYNAMRGEREQRARLIRRIDNITVLAANSPEEVGNPFKAQGFGLWRGTVKGIFSTLEKLQDENQFEMEELGWLMKLPMPIEAKPDDPTIPVEFRWYEVTDGTMLDGTAMVVINSAFCTYDSEMGFRIVPPSMGGWSSEPGEMIRRNSQGGYSYRLESYSDHIGQMLRIYRNKFSDDYLYVQRQVAQAWGLPPNCLATAIQTAIALHDVAKLDKRWQRWVRLYQQGIDEAIDDPNYMAVHTNWLPIDPEHRESRRLADRQCKKPHHAGESAIAGALIIKEVCSDNESLIRAVLTAITRHHNAFTHSFDEYTLHPGAVKAVQEALRLTDMGESNATLLIESPSGVKLEEQMIEGKSFRQLLLYLWTVRMLRLCDGMSQE